MTTSRIIRRLLGNTSGVAMTEFALGAPFLLMAGMWGIEMANYALANMKISQLAMHVADNASRIGDTSTLQNRKVFEGDIGDLLIGANLQGGKSIDLYENGRVFISSLEVWDQSVHAANVATPQAQGTQFIHWQRCLGGKNVTSSYGKENNAMPNGIGPAGDEVSAEQSNAVIFVEISYDYKPLISKSFIPNREIRAIASFMVRDSRDLSKLYQRNQAKPDVIADCKNYTNASVLL
jgi:hypothetical protein